MVANVLVIMSLPIAIVSYSSELGTSWFYSSILFALEGGTLPSMPAYPGFAWPDLRFIVVALVLCSPGVWFNHWLKLQRRGISIKKQLIAVSVITPILAFFLSSILLLSTIDPWFYYPNPTDFVTSWVLVVLVFLPVFTREGSFISLSQSDDSVQLNAENRSPSRWQLPSRGVATGFVMGVLSLVSPTTADLLLSDLYGTLVHVRSAFWTGTLGILQELDYVFTRISFYPAPLSLDPLSFTQFFFGIYVMLLPRSIFAILFGYSVLRYLRSQASGRRTLLLAALSVIGPFVSFVALYFLFPEYLSDFNRFFVPLPLLQIIGLLLMFYITPIQPDEPEPEMTDVALVFDSTSKTQVQAPESGPQVKIPTTYMLKSRVGRLRRLRKKTDSQEDSDAAEVS